MSDDKHLSGEEKRQKMKEQFKKELRDRKEFITRVNGLRKMQSINKALANMKVEDDSDTWIEQLNQETAFNEAKTEMALEAAGAVNPEGEATTEQQLAMSEAEMQKLAAEQMVARMKAELAAEAEGGVASTNLEAQPEVEEVAAASSRLIEIEISDEGEVTNAEKSVESTSNDDGPVRRMMGGAIDSVEDIAE